MKIALIDYRMGNLASVRKALERSGAEPVILDTPEKLMDFPVCLLPGVGNFGDGMRNLSAAGFVEPLREFYREKRYLFGICLGMQMMLEASDEAPGVAGLGLFRGRVLRFPAGGEKVPQIGWNKVGFLPGSAVAEMLPAEPWFYFVHSYYVPLASYTAARAEYMLPFSAAIAQGRCFATQFHPEKSQNCGRILLESMLRFAAKGEQ